MEIRLTELSDLKEIAACHKAAFPESLSSKLGVAFRKKMLSWYVLDDRGIIFHITDKGKIIGYCGGLIAKLPGLPGAATSITQFSFKVFISSFMLRPWLIFHPENVSRLSFIVRNILLKLGLKKLKNIEQIKQENFQSFWGLVVIGVDPNYQGKGIGSALLQEFERLAGIDKVNRISLSVKSTNLKAIKSYISNGWFINNSTIDSLNLMKIL